MGKRYLFGLRGRALEHGLIAAIIFPAYTLLGWNNGIVGSLLDVPSWVETFPRINTLSVSGAQAQDNAQIQGTVVALYPLGAFIGALSCILVGDVLGRRRTMGLGAIVQIIGVILETASYSLGQLVVGRLFTGIGFGMLSATAPNWQSECSSAEHRGAAVIFESVFISLGLALQGWVSFGVGFASGSVTWRFPLSISAFWALLVLAGLTVVPESPRWLTKKGRIEEAREVLAALADKDPQSPEISSEITSIETSIAATGEVRFFDVFKNGDQRYFNRLVIACAAGAFQQLNGINALAFYLTTIFEQYLGLSGTDSRILSAAVFTWQTVCSPIGVLTVDRLGRRKLMIASALGMGISMAMVSGLASQTQNRAAEGAAVAFVFTFSIFFPIGFLGMAFLYASEVSPLSARTYITAMSTSSVWIWNFAVVEATPKGLATITYRYFIVWACVNLFLITPTVYFFFPETNQRSLEDMDNIFLASNTFFDPVRVSRLKGLEGASAAERKQSATMQEEEVMQGSRTHEEEEAEQKL